MGRSFIWALIFKDEPIFSSFCDPFQAFPSCLGEDTQIHLSIDNRIFGACQLHPKKKAEGTRKAEVEKAHADWCDQRVLGIPAEMRGQEKGDARIAMKWQVAAAALTWPMEFLIASRNAHRRLSTRTQLFWIAALAASSTFHCCRGHARHALKQHERAIADYNEAIRLDPSHANAFNNRAWIWATCSDAKFRDGRKAVGSVTIVLRADPKNAAYMDTLAAAYAECGDFAEAVRWQEKALADPQLKDNAELRHRLELYRDKKPYRQD